MTIWFGTYSPVNQEWTWLPIEGSNRYYYAATLRRTYLRWGYRCRIGYSSAMSVWAE